MIVLNEARLDAQLRECPFVVAFQKKSALIAEHARLKNEDAGQ